MYACRYLEHYELNKGTIPCRIDCSFYLSAMGIVSSAAPVPEYGAEGTLYGVIGAGLSDPVSDQDISTVMDSLLESYPSVSRSSEHGRSAIYCGRVFDGDAVLLPFLSWWLNRKIAVLAPGTGTDEFSILIRFGAMGGKPEFTKIKNLGRLKRWMREHSDYLVLGYCKQNWFKLGYKTICDQSVAAEN